MQLRVPKKYQPRRRRRRLISWRLLTLLLVTTTGCMLAYAAMQNPEPFRQGASNAIEWGEEQVSAARDNMFPVEPTATPDVRQELVECDNAYLIGDLERMIDLCQEALPGRPNDVELHYRIAYAMAITSSLGTNTERINGAVDMSRQTITANPESALGWAVMAYALDLSGEHSRALPFALRALDLDSDLTIAKAHLANIYRNVGRPELAASTLESAMVDLEIVGGDNETRAQVYRNYARYLMTVPDFEQALEYYQLARQTMPNHTYITIEMSDAYLGMAFRTGDASYTEQALVILEEMLAAAPRDPFLLFKLGELYSRDGQAPRAAEMYNRCLDADPDSVPCLSRSGWINYGSGLYDLAIENLSRATQLGSTHPYDWYLLGRSYFRRIPSDCGSAIGPLQEGMRLRQEIEVTQVDVDDFRDALRACEVTP